jgi:hypothetical protein
MQGYSPIVADRSGEFLAQGITGAAQANAQGMSQLGGNIGSALMDIGKAYKEDAEQRAGGKAFKNVFGVIAPSLGINQEQLSNLFGKDIKTDKDWYHAATVLNPLLPSMVTARAYQTRLDQTQAAATAAPIARLYNDNQKKITTQGGPGIPMTGLPQASMFGGGG